MQPAITSTRSQTTPFLKRWEIPLAAITACSVMAYNDPSFFDAIQGAFKTAGLAAASGLGAAALSLSASACILRSGTPQERKTRFFQILTLQMIHAAALAGASAFVATSREQETNGALLAASLIACLTGVFAGPFTAQHYTQLACQKRDQKTKTNSFEFAGTGALLGIFSGIVSRAAGCSSAQAGLAACCSSAGSIYQAVHLWIFSKKPQPS